VSTETGYFHTQQLDLLRFLDQLETEIPTGQ